MTVSRKKEINDVDYSLNYLEHGTVQFVGKVEIPESREQEAYFLL